VLHNDRFEIFVQWVALEAQHLALEQLPDLDRQCLESVVEEQQLPEVDQHADLCWQRPQFVEREVEAPQAAQARNVGRQLLQPVVVEVQPRQEVVAEQRRRHQPQGLAAHVELGPGLVLGLVRRVVGARALSLLAVAG
jgi:hypothetical protein